MVIDQLAIPSRGVAEWAGRAALCTLLSLLTAACSRASSPVEDAPGESGGAGAGGETSDAGAESGNRINCTYLQVEADCRIRCYDQSALVSGADCRGGSNPFECACQYGSKVGSTFQAQHCNQALATVREHCGP